MTFIALSLLPFSTFGQTNYVVTAKGDTLRGELKLFSYDLIDRIQVTDLSKRATYSALQIRSINMDGATYRPERNENAIRFMKVLKDGFLSYYAFTSSQNMWDGRYLKKKDGTGIEVPNLGFKKILARFLGDCKEISDRIDRGEFSKKDVEQIVDLYNVCLQAKTEALVRNPKPVSVVVDIDKALAVKNLVTKVEAENFLTKKDALDVLRDIQSKVSKNEAIPNYLIEGLKSYLADTPTLTNDLDALVALLKK
ncbi:MAG TPA: hypothetical protein VKQ08_03595 [Cyclobacteriaceae bacterium]|nr:hypothetical protein [Cyclobacteriaceae bacterium]